MGGQWRMLGPISVLISEEHRDKEEEIVEVLQDRLIMWAEQVVNDEAIPAGAISQVIA